MPVRLDQLVALRFGLSRRAAREEVRNGRIDLHGAVHQEPGTPVEPDAQLSHHPNRPRVRIVRSAAVEVLYEDTDVLIVNKPAGLLTLPTARHETDTLLDRVRRYLAIRRGGLPYVGIIHRLDRDTSGALALACSPAALQAFQAMFRAHDVERRYLAVVAGIMSEPEGTIDLPLISTPGKSRRRVAYDGEVGKTAITHYRVLERFANRATSLACWLETGRSHQIRVHLAKHGHPVLGDRIYRPRRGRPLPFRRQALHAQTLGFLHPLRVGVAVQVEAAVPSDLLGLLSRLRRLPGPDVKKTR